MPGDDLKLDNDGDYVDDGAGGFELTETAQPTLRHQMLDRRGFVIFDPESGRRQKGIRGIQDTPESLADEEDSVLEALEPLVQGGIIDNVETLVDQDQIGRQAIAVRTRDTQSGGTLSFSPFTEFGG